MMNKLFCWLFAVICTVMLSFPEHILAQDDRGSFSGYLYTDYYWIAQNHNEDLEGENGFWTRRVYFTYDYDISPALTSRFRLEMNSPGDFSSSSRMVPFVKDLYLDWAINDNHSLVAGISGTPTWGLVESVWGYRSLEKSPLDLHAMGSSRDFGIALKGQLGQTGDVNYHLMVGNGSEPNRWKKYMLSLGWWLTDNLVIEGYGDYDQIDENTTRYTLQGFAGYVSDQISLGAMFAVNHEEEEITGTDDRSMTREVASLFGNFSMGDSWTSILRVDHMFSANPLGPGISYIPFSDQAPSTFLLAGVDYEAFSNLHVMPNIETIIYSENDAGHTPDTDIIPRLTLFYRF